MLLYLILSLHALLISVNGSDNSQLPPAMQMPNTPLFYQNPFGFRYGFDEFQDLPVTTYSDHTLQDIRDRRRYADAQREDGIWTALSMTAVVNPNPDHDDSPMSKNIKVGEVVAIEGFQYCSGLLDKSTFWKNAKFYPIFSHNPDRDMRKMKKQLPVTIEQFGYKKFVEFIDKIAAQIVRDVQIYRSEDVKEVPFEHIRRLGCYLAADGQNSYVKYGTQKLLINVWGTNWFPEISWATPKLPFATPLINVNRPLGRRSKQPLLLPSSNDEIKMNVEKPHYPIAYTILCHNNLEGLEYLIDTLMSPISFVMIHIDGKVPKFRLKVLEMIHKNTHKWNDQVRVTSKSFKGGWGLTGLVYGQLAAYFDLLDSITFEYVLNASSNDVALMDAEVMYQKLRYEYGNPQSNYLANLHKNSEWAVNENYGRPNRRATFVTKDNKPKFGDKVPREAEYLGISSYKGYSYHTTHQWNILTYAFVHTMRQDPKAPTLLVPLEWAFLTDELYFSLYSQWSDVWASTIDDRNTRGIFHDGIRWDGPGKITENAEWFVNDCFDSQLFFMRKWHIDENPGLQALFDEKRHTLKKLREQESEQETEQESGEPQKQEAEQGPVEQERHDEKGHQNHKDEQSPQPAETRYEQPESNSNNSNKSEKKKANIFKKAGRKVKKTFNSFWAKMKRWGRNVRNFRFRKPTQNDKNKNN